MSGSFELQIASVLILIELAKKRALDVSGASIVALDEIAVVGVHHSNQISQISRSSRVQRFPEHRRD